MRRWRYELGFCDDPDGWRVVVRGTSRVWVSGPWADRDAAERAVLALVRRWRRRAEAHGGWVWRPRATEVGVCLPDEVPVRDALPFEAPPCSVAPVPGIARPASRDLPVQTECAAHSDGSTIPMTTDTSG